MCDCTNDLIVQYKPVTSGKIPTDDVAFKKIKYILNVVQITSLITGVLILIVVFIIWILDGSKVGTKDKFSAGYDLELELFSKMNAEEQQEYLNMSRDSKLAKYPQLI